MTPLDSETKWCADLYDQCAELHEARARAYRQQAASLRGLHSTGGIIMHHTGKAPVEPDWHNPENLPSPGGPEWRFLLKSEGVIPEDAEYFVPSETCDKSEWVPSSYRGQRVSHTDAYRTRQPLPTT